jgi:hypothetical protein
METSKDELAISVSRLHQVAYFCETAVLVYKFLAQELVSFVNENKQSPPLIVIQPIPDCYFDFGLVPHIPVESGLTFQLAPEPSPNVTIGVRKFGLQVTVDYELRRRIVVAQLNLLQERGFAQLTPAIDQAGSVSIPKVIQLALPPIEHLARGACGRIRIRLNQPHWQCEVKEVATPAIRLRRQKDDHGLIDETA